MTPAARSKGGEAGAHAEIQGAAASGGSAAVIQLIANSVQCKQKGAKERGGDDNNQLRSESGYRQYGREKSFRKSHWPGEEPEKLCGEVGKVWTLELEWFVFNPSSAIVSYTP